jgi:hypothetical protein
MAFVLLHLTRRPELKTVAKPLGPLEPGQAITTLDFELSGKMAIRVATD